MSDHFPLLKRDDFIRVLLALGLSLREGNKHDHVVGSYNGRKIQPIQIPNEHKKEYNSSHGYVAAAVRKLGVTKKEFYQLVKTHS